MCCSSVVSRDSVRIALTIAALNDLDALVCDIQNTSLTADCREKVWMIAGPEFGSECGKNMLEGFARIEKLWRSIQIVPGRDARCDGSQAKLCQPRCVAATGSKTGWL
jgi:hypothetical protein